MPRRRAAPRPTSTVFFTSAPCFALAASAPKRSRARSWRAADLVGSSGLPCLRGFFLPAAAPAFLAPPAPPFALAPAAAASSSNASRVRWLGRG